MPKLSRTRRPVKIGCGGDKAHLLSRTELRPGYDVGAEQQQRGHGAEDAMQYGRPDAFRAGTIMRASSTNDRCAERQFRPHRAERRPEVVQDISSQFVQVHGDALATGVMAGEGDGSESCEADDGATAAPAVADLGVLPGPEA